MILHFELNFVNLPEIHFYYKARCPGLSGNQLQRYGFPDILCPIFLALIAHED